MQERPKKLRGGLNQEIAKLKAAWQKMPDEIRKGWLDRLHSSETRREIRERIQRELNVNLVHDTQVTRIRYWAVDQEKRNEAAREKEETTKKLLAEGKSLAEVQETLLRQATKHSLNEGDYNLGLKASSEITKVQNTALSREKFEFNKTEVAMKHVDELKAIKKNSTLTDREKLLQARKLLFGHIPEEPNPTTN
jgi:hypothetical protein